MRLISERGEADDQKSALLIFCFLTITLFSNSEPNQRAFRLVNLVR